MPIYYAATIAKCTPLPLPLSKQHRLGPDAPMHPCRSNLPTDLESRRACSNMALRQSSRAQAGSDRRKVAQCPFQQLQICSEQPIPCLCLCLSISVSDLLPFRATPTDQLPLWCPNSVAAQIHRALMVQRQPGRAVKCPSTDAEWLDAQSIKAQKCSKTRAHGIPHPSKTDTAGTPTMQTESRPGSQ